MLSVLQSFRNSLKKILSFGLVAAIAVACVPVSVKEKPVISVSILPYKYFAERIAGDNFEIQVITPPGVSPETYEPTPKQIKDLSNSVIFFVNGNLIFEDHIIDKSEKRSETLTVDLSKDIDLIAGEVVDHGDHVHLHGIDPHHWLSPAEVRIQINTILKTLLEFDPDNKEMYMANYEDFTKDIDKLDNHIKGLLAHSPIKTFLIYHPAFTYFARTYGLEQIALESDGKEPTGSHIKNIIDVARKLNIHTILVQSQFNTASAEVVAAEISGKIEILNPLEEDWLAGMYAISHTMQKALNP